jgi:hypothetical protein
MDSGWHPIGVNMRRGMRRVDEHLIELQHLYGFQPFTSKKYREIAQALIPLADQTHQAVVLVRSVIDQLRRKQVIIPPLSCRICFHRP